MNLSSLGPAILAAIVACCLADWIFMGVLFRSRYLVYPEVWRAAAGQKQTAAIGLSMAFNVVTAAATMFAIGFLGLSSRSLALTMTVTMWAAVALPILVNWGMFAKVDPMVIVCQAAGWLAKLVAIGLIASQFL